MISFKWMQIIKIEEQIMNQPHMCVFLIQKLLYR